MSKYPIRFRRDDKETWPREGQFVIVTDPSNPFPYSVERFVLFDKHLHETTSEEGTPVLEEGCFWMPLPEKMLTIEDSPHQFNKPSNAVSRVQRTWQIHPETKPHE